MGGDLRIRLHRRRQTPDCRLNGPAAIRISIHIRRDGDDSQTSIEFDDPRVTLGRSSASDIQLPFRVVSGHHLTFQRDGARYLVRDENSTNGTEFDGEMMEPEQWREIEGETRLRIVHILLDVELDASDVDQFTLAETGTMARQMLGEALDESDDLAFFEIAEGPDAGRRFHLPDDLEHGIVGGAPGCDVRVSGEDVVPRAAVVRFEHQGFQLETTGETTVQKNGHPVEEPTRLADGDRVVFDGCTLTFHDPLESHLLELEGLDDESRVESTDMPEPDRTPAERDGTSRSTPSPDSERRPADADAGPGDTAPTAEDRRRERKNRVDESGGRETASNEMDAERSSGWGLLEAALLTITLLFLGLVGGILAVTFGLV